MNSMPMAEHRPHIRANDWEALAKLLAESAQRSRRPEPTSLSVLITLITNVQVPDPQSLIPWLHIAGAVAEEAHRLGYVRLGILGTKYLMEGTVYPEALEEFRIASKIPDEADRKKINEIIFKELVNGVFPETSRLYFNEVAEKFKARGCDAVVLGCTEIPIVRPTTTSTHFRLDALLARHREDSARRRGSPSLA